MDWLGSLDLARKLAPIGAKSFIIKLIEILLNCKILFDVTIRLKFKWLTLCMINAINDVISKMISKYYMILKYFKED